MQVNGIIDALLCNSAYYLLRMRHEASEGIIGVDAEDKSTVLRWDRDC